MSNITFFCFTTFCVNLPINSPDEITRLTWELHYLESSIEVIDWKLEFFEDKLKLIHVRDYNDIVFSRRNGSVFAHIGPALQAVRDAVETAKNEGRNSSHCFTIAQNRLRDEANQRYNFDLVSCQANFTGAVQEILQRVEPLRESLKPVHTLFDIIVPHCYNSNHTAECLSIAVSSMKKTRTTLENSVTPLLLIEQTTYPKLKENFAACILAITTSIKDAAILAQSEGIRCVQTTEKVIHQST